MHPFQELTRRLTWLIAASTAFFLGVGLANLATGFVGGPLATIAFFVLGAWGVYSVRSLWRLRQVAPRRGPSGGVPRSTWAVLFGALVVFAGATYVLAQDATTTALIAATLAFCIGAGALLGKKLVEAWSDEDK